MLKYDGNMQIMELTRLMQQTCEGVNISDEWKTSVLFPFFKETISRKKDGRRAPKKSVYEAMGHVNTGWA
jgi:hypothetical protein